MVALETFVATTHAVFLEQKHAAVRETITRAPEYQRFSTLDRDGWLTLSERDYDALDAMIWRLHTGYPNPLKPALSPIQDNSAVDLAGLRQHIYMMHNMETIYWSSQNFRALLPPNTTLSFAHTCDLFHDFGRFGGINGHDLLLADAHSHDLVAELFPGFPQDEFLHDIRYIGDIAPAPDPFLYPFIYWMKLIDTTAKIPRRHPYTLFQPRGAYDAWAERARAEGKFPLSNGVDAMTYMRSDRAMTLAAKALITKVVPDILFDEALDEAADMTMGR